jgi:hypothetical protein
MSVAGLATPRSLNVNDDADTEGHEKSGEMR